MKIAAAYIRVSTEDQIEYSPDSQLKAIQNYAQKNGYYLPEQYIFMDEGITGRNTKKREGFKQMISLAKTKPKPFDLILVWKYSRFARNREDSVVYKSMLRKQCGIDVVSISEAVGDDKMSILFEAMIEAMDEYYSINLAEEVKRGMTEKAKRGGILSVAPFGYEVKNGEYVIVEQEAEVIRTVFSEYAMGSGFLTLAKKLNALGVTTHRGNPIENRTVEYWLNNPVYIGKIRWNPTGRTSRDYHNKNLIISDGTHKPIINDELWNITQQRLRENKQIYKKYSRDPSKGMAHWMNGVLRCGKCGRSLVYCSGFYYCSNKGRGLCPGNGSVSANVIAKMVISKFEQLLDCEDIQLNFEKKNNLDCVKDSVSDTLRIIKLKIDETDKRLERAREAYEADIDTIDEYKANKNRILNEKKSLEQLLNEEQLSIKKNNTDCRVNKKNITKIKEDIKKVSDILKSGNIKNEEKNTVLKSIIKEIVKTGEDGRTFNFVFWNPST